jgi:hypothetical protein
MNEDLIRYLASRNIYPERYTDARQLRRDLVQTVLEHYGVSSLKEAFINYKQSRGFIKAIPTIVERTIIKNILTQKGKVYYKLERLRIIKGRYVVVDERGRFKAWGWRV